MNPPDAGFNSSAICVTDVVSVMGILLEKTETYINVRYLSTLPSISERAKVNKITFLKDTLRLLQVTVKTDHLF